MRVFLSYFLIVNFAMAQTTGITTTFPLPVVEQMNTVKCEESTTEEGPFQVTDASGMGWKTYENFRSKDNHRKKDNIIPRRSIVKVKKGSEEFAEHPNSYVPVEVLGVADTDYHDDNLKKGRLRSASAKVNWQKLKKVNKGKKGFLYSKSLKKADEYTYIVTEDSPLLADNGLTDMGVVAIRPEKGLDGGFAIEKCCDQQSLEVSVMLPVCTTRYKFRLVYADDTEGKEIFVDVDQCGVAENLVPFKNNDISALMTHFELSKNSGVGFDMSKIEYIDEKGMAKMPLDYESFDGNGMKGPFGSYHYNADDKGASDVYGKPLTTCAFMKVLEKHQKDCTEPGCQVQFGDMFHLRDWGPHQYHGAGRCIDIRPLKTEDNLMGTSYRSTIYDREKTEKFINLLKKAGGTSVVFDDPKVPGVARTANQSHADHIHVCFDPKSKIVKKTCYQGLE